MFILDFNYISLKFRIFERKKKSCKQIDLVDFYGPYK